MTGPRLLLSLILAASVLAPLRADGPGRFPRRLKTDPTRVRQLVTIVTSDPDEGRRKAAVQALAEVDPRVHVEVMPGLIAALRRDPEVAVRVEAAEVIGRLPVVFPLAGLALEAAAGTDPSPLVRSAAQDALWHYHLRGYRPAQGVVERVVQTAEPPLARRPPTEAVSRVEPPLAPATGVAIALPARRPAPETLPPLGPPPGPRIGWMPPGPRSWVTADRVNAVSTEPPLARPDPAPPPAPVLFGEPPLLPRWPEAVPYVRPAPGFLDLPPIVSPP